MARMDINIFIRSDSSSSSAWRANTILIIQEFRKISRKVVVAEATLKAYELRLRQIIMTSLAFILGVVPGAPGAKAEEMRRTLGTAVFSGMLGVTIFGIFLTPVFYFVIQWWADSRAARRPVEELEEESTPDDLIKEEQLNVTSCGRLPHGGHSTGNGAVHGAQGATVH